MTVTLRMLLEHKPLQLQLLAGEEAIDLPIRWVHVSEILDPTGWLQGGELLLTTGLRLTDETSMREYVDRLARHRIAGIGFGTGTEPVTIFEEVPDAFIAAACQRKLPLFVVPFDTPYVAISEFVSTRLAAEQYRTVQRAFDAQRQLTAAAIPGDTTKIITHLTQLIDGWCIMTTAEGSVTSAVPSSAIAKVHNYERDIQRVRLGGSVVSIGEPGGKSTAVHPLGPRMRPRRLLIVGKDSSFSEYDRIVIAAAVALLSIEVERQLSLSAVRHQLNEHLARVVLHPDVNDSEKLRLLSQLGFRTRSAFRIARISHSEVPFTMAKVVHDLFSESDIPAVCITDPGHPHHFVVLCQERPTHTISRLRSLYRDHELTRVSLGTSSILTPNDLQKGLKQALLALRHAEATQIGFVDFDTLPPLQLLLGAVSSELLESFQFSALGSMQQLDSTLRGHAVEAVEAFLRFNGVWSAAADSLGIHRQTLVKRIRQVELELGLNFESADERAGLWLAFAAKSVVERSTIRTVPKELTPRGNSPRSEHET